MSDMAVHALGVVLTVALLAGVAPPGQAEAPLERSIGVRVGISGPNKGEQFHEVEGFALIELPWRWQWNSGWSVATEIDLALGVLSGAGKSAAIGSFSPGLAVNRRGSRFSLLAYTGIVLVSEHDFDQQAIGGPFQFGLYAGANYRFSNGIRLSYRYRHLSNAGFFRPNPGLEMHFVGLSYAFQINTKR